MRARDHERGAEGARPARRRRWWWWVLLLAAALAPYALLWVSPHAARRASSAAPTLTSSPARPATVERSAREAPKAALMSTASPSPPELGQFDREYEAIVGANADYDPRTLCELLDGLGDRGAAGVYRVQALRGRSEQIRDDGALGGYTYVDLERVAAATPNAPARATARIVGGPVGGLGEASWDVSLAKGEVVGVLLRPLDALTGAFTFNTLEVFQPIAGGFSNGQLRMQGRLEDAFESAVRRARTQGCATEAQASGRAHANEHPHGRVLTLGVAARLRMIDEAEVIVEDGIVTAEVAIPDPLQ